MTILVIKIFAQKNFKINIHQFLLFYPLNPLCPIIHSISTTQYPPVNIHHSISTPIIHSNYPPNIHSISNYPLQLSTQYPLNIQLSTPIIHSISTTQYPLNIQLSFSNYPLNIQLSTPIIHSISTTQYPIIHPISINSLCFQVFFTRNGALLGRVEALVPRGGFYPTISLGGKKETVRVDLRPLSG